MIVAAEGSQGAYQGRDSRDSGQPGNAPTATEGQGSPAPSLRIMAKLAMTEEGVIRENVKTRGEWWSSSQWSILHIERK